MRDAKHQPYIVELDGWASFRNSCDEACNNWYLFMKLLFR